MVEAARECVAIYCNHGCYRIFVIVLDPNVLNVRWNWWEVQPQAWEYMDTIFAHVGDDIARQCDEDVAANVVVSWHRENE